MPSSPGRKKRLTVVRKIRFGDHVVVAILVVSLAALVFLYNLVSEVMLTHKTLSLKRLHLESRGREPRPLSLGDWEVDGNLGSCVR